MRKILFTTAALAVFGLLAAPAMAQVQNPPKKANKLIITMVEGVQACTVANTSTGGVINLPACDAQPADSLCEFTTKNGKLRGLGMAKAIARKGDIFLNVKVNGINDACNGESLCTVANFRATQNNCSNSAACTTTDQVDFPLGLSCCTVDKGKCRIKTSVNEALAGAINGANTPSYTINGVGLSRVGGGVAFRGGLLVLP